MRGQKYGNQNVEGRSWKIALRLRSGTKEDGFQDAWVVF